MTIYIGVDVSKKKLDIFIKNENKFLSIENSVEAINNFIKTLNYQDDVIVGLESTSKYHLDMFEQLSLQGYKVCILNPKRVHNFFKAYGDIAKTDKKDAQLIAVFLEKMNPKVTSFSQENKELKELFIRRNQLVASMTVQKNYLEKNSNKTVVKSINRTLTFFKKELAKIEESLTAIIDKHYCVEKEILQSVPGIGKVASMSILSTLPEIGQLSARQIASLAGLAPKNRDSGQYKGTRSIIGGRMPVRNNLYMSVISLIRLKDNKLSEFYRKLREQGKPAKVAIIATARKLLIILNSMIKNKTKWNEA